MISRINLRIALSIIAIAMVAIGILPSSSASAQRQDTPPYGKRGPFVVGTREVTIPADSAGHTQSLKATVWYPALNPDNAKQQATYTDGLLVGTGRAIRDAAPDAKQGPYPLIVYSHGLSGIRFQSLFYVEHLASYGFVVIAADHPGSTFGAMSNDSVVASFATRPLEILAEIKFAEGLTAAGGPLAGVIDMQTIGVTGHSLGGYTALAAAGARLDFDGLATWCAGTLPKEIHAEVPCAFLKQIDAVARARGLSVPPQGLWPATTDPRIKAVLAQAPAALPLFGARGLAPITIPMLIEVGTKDRAAVPERDAYPAFDQVGSAQKSMVMFENADHYIFIEKCTPLIISLGMASLCSDSVWDMDRAHDLIDHFAAAFFLATLKSDAKAAQALSPAAVAVVGLDYKSTLK